MVTIISNFKDGETRLSGLKKNALVHTANELREVGLQAKCPGSYCCYSRQMEGARKGGKPEKHRVFGN